MRKIVIILLAFIIGVNCFSQTKQPVKQKLNYLGNLIYLDENSDFHQNSFVLGWHWYSGYKMSSALSVNQIHVNSEVPKYEFGPLRYLNPEIETKRKRIKRETLSFRKLQNLNYLYYN